MAETSPDHDQFYPDVQRRMSAEIQFWLKATIEFGVLHDGCSINTVMFDAVEVCRVLPERSVGL